jgi:outer membrane protein, heavy metal efflux system
VSRRTVDHEGSYGEYDGTISRALRLPGKASLDRRAGALGVEVAANRAEDARHQAALILARLWYDWLGASARHHNASETLVNLQKAAQAVRRRVAARDAAELDNDQALSAVAGVELRVGEAAAARDRARAELAASFPKLSLPVQAPDVAEPAASDIVLSELADLAVERSHDITAAAKEAERQQALSQRVRRDRLPDPTIGFRAFQERGGIEKGAGVYLSVPFSGRYRSALADEAAATATAAMADSAAVRREVAAHSAGDLAETRARLSAWRSSRDAVARAEAAALKIARGQSVGVIDLADRLYADRIAYEARASEIEARVAAAYALTRMRIDAHSLWID